MYQHIDTGDANPVSLSFSSIRYEVPTKSGKKVILEDVSGHVPCGSFLAILGSSGAGKSSLLDILAGRNKTGKVGGTILFNGKPRPKDLRHSAYVMQDDALIGSLTVQETLEYTLRLRVPSSEAGKQQRALRVNALLQDLSLMKVKTSRTGTALHRGISGGERRRLSIAVEMVTGPNIVFLDEPTTGLDSHNALKVMKSLKKLCELQVTVICTVHQPRSNIFHLFDNLLLLDRGKTVYYGANAVDYFNEMGLLCPQYMNPADFLLDVILQDGDAGEQVYAMENATVSLKDFGDFSAPTAPLLSESSGDLVALNSSDVGIPYTSMDLIEKFSESETNRLLRNELSTIVDELICDTDDLHTFKTIKIKPKVSRFTQMNVLLSRTWRQTIRDSNVLYVRTFAAIFIALLVGVIFFQLADDSSSNGNRLNSILFLMCVFSLFCLPAISKFIEERLIFTREHASGYYSTLPYCISGFLCELPILLGTVLVYGTISYWMVGFYPTLKAFMFFLAIVFLVIQVAYASCQVIAANVKTVNMAIAMYVMFLLYSLLLGGFLVHQDTLPEKCQWMVYTSYFYYGFAALTVNEFENRSYGQSVITGLSLEDVNKGVNLAVLLGVWIVLKLVEYLCLRFFTKEKR